MRFKRKKISSLVLFFLIACGISHGQNQGTSSLQFLKIIPSARIMAMGESGVATQNDAEAPFLNPAGLAFLKDTDIRFSIVDWFIDTKIYALSVGYFFSKYGTLGLNIVDVDYGEFVETRVDALGFIGETYNPGLTGNTFRAGAILIGLSYGRELTDRFSFGITANYIQEDLYLDKMNTLMFDFGMLYNSKLKSLKFGITLKNLGPKVVYVKDKNTIPQTILIGLSADMLSATDNLITFSENHRVTMAFDISIPRDDSQKYHLGLEYALFERYKIRLGYKVNYDIEGLSVGTGFNYKFISIDYAYNDMGEFWEPAHRFSIGLAF